MGETPAPQWVGLVEQMGAALGRPLRAPTVSYVRYVDARSTISERQGRVHVRLSHHLADAPVEAVQGVVGVLLCRLLGLPQGRIDGRLVRAYRRFLDTPEVAERVRAERSRGRKHIDPTGRHRSLLESYLRVTLDMGLSPPVPPRLSWSQRVSGHRFGHWDPDHQVIVISQILDDPEVPEWVLDYVVYHEVLHILHPVRAGSGLRRIVHGAAFRRQERLFPQWKEGERWIQQLARAHRG
ncbi:MAG: hypothetical protein ACYDBQ_09165 [Thermoplasmatota archaeon]